MTTDTARPISINQDSSAGRVSATWIAGGAAWVAAGLLFAEDGWRFTTASAIWFVSDILLLLALAGLLRLRPHGESAVGSVALWVAIAARVLFAAGEATSLATGNDEGPLIPFGALLTAISLTTYAVVVLRRHQLAGPLRWALLALGLYPFVAMFPALAITGEPNYLLIGLWGIPAVLVGSSIRTGRRDQG
jgi:hypothetical protein